jgi:hypothetical protein
MSPPVERRDREAGRRGTCGRRDDLTDSPRSGGGGARTFTRLDEREALWNRRCHGRAVRDMGKSSRTVSESTSRSIVE